MESREGVALVASEPRTGALAVCGPLQGSLWVLWPERERSDQPNWGCCCELVWDARVAGPRVAAELDASRRADRSGRPIKQQRTVGHTACASSNCVTASDASGVRCMRLCVVVDTEPAAAVATPSSMVRALRLAAAGEDKTVRVFQRPYPDSSASWHCLLEYICPKRLCAIDLAHNGRYVLVADKTGNVYAFDLDESLAAADTASPLTCQPEYARREGYREPVMGHFSLITDLQVSDDGRYVATADVDGHMRISRLPQVYDIVRIIPSCGGDARTVAADDYITRLCWLPASSVLMGLGTGVWMSSECAFEAPVHCGVLNGVVSESAPSSPRLVCVAVDRYARLMLCVSRDGQYALKRMPEAHDGPNTDADLLAVDAARLSVAEPTDICRWWPAGDERAFAPPWLVIAWAPRGEADETETKSLLRDGVLSWLQVVPWKMADGKSTNERLLSASPDDLQRALNQALIAGIRRHARPEDTPPQPAPRRLYRARDHAPAAWLAYWHRANDHDR
ncbi:hypothetical protein CDCA_CDCA08G2290 [Cyanidium caldarium]|uniref:Uncharacterized protein n=1 Tax=Cyanidium caldarium TaxID=2771 RepID=A0AAV9IVZ2_CYACA|nr:hypothetical protein CDCA_CDCA08G2290 [Cyanidium caldarium]